MDGSGGNAGAGTPVTPQSLFGDNVYRPSLDGLTDGADDPTPLITDYTGEDTFSMEELGVSPIRELTPQPAGRRTESGRRGMSVDDDEPVAGDGGEDSDEAHVQA